MPIISLSSHLGSKAARIARRVADATGYRLLDRGFLDEIAERHGVSRASLLDLLDNAPRFLGIGSRSRRRNLAILQQAVLEELLHDRIVTIGLAAHLYVTGVSHFIRVRVVGDQEERARALSEEQGISVEKAARLIKLHDRRRLHWSLEFFDLDESDPALHDLVIDLGATPEDEAVRTICEAAAARLYQPITYSVKCLQDQALAARVRVALFDPYPDIEVKARGTTVYVRAKAPARHRHRRVAAIKEAAQEVAGVDYVEVHLSGDSFRQATAGIP